MPLLTLKYQVCFVLDCPSIRCMVVLDIVCLSHALDFYFDVATGYFFWEHIVLLKKDIELEKYKNGHLYNLSIQPILGPIMAIIE